MIGDGVVMMIASLRIPKGLPDFVGMYGRGEWAKRIWKPTLDAAGSWTVEGGMMWDEVDPVNLLQAASCQYTPFHITSHSSHLPAFRRRPIATG